MAERSGFFGFELESVEAPPESTAALAARAADHLRRHEDLLSALMRQGIDRVTYDLRLISEPHPEASSQGRISLGVLGRVDRGSETEVQAEYLLGLFHGLLQEYAFARADEDRLESLRAPFPVRHSVGLSRRVRRERLDTLRGGPASPRMGFGQAGVIRADHDRADTGLVHHVCPFVPTLLSFDRAGRMLLRHTEPVALSIRLRPTVLTGEEETFLEEQLARCELFAQLGLGMATGELDGLRPTFRDQARLYGDHQARVLASLRAGAGLVTVELGSPKPLPAALVDAVAGLLTAPAQRGGDGDQSSLLPIGGYAALESETLSERRALAFAEARLELPDGPELLAAGGRLSRLFGAPEAAGVFRLPFVEPESLCGLPVRTWRAKAAPPGLRSEGCLLGQNISARGAQAVRLGTDDRRRHTYIVGQTGCGKTTLIETMALDDIRAGRGLCLVDPHGDLFQSLLGKIPADRVADVVVLDPTDEEYPLGLNMLECTAPAQRYFVAQEMVNITTRLLQDEYGIGGLERLVGPVFFQHMRMNLLLAMSDPSDPGTLLEFYMIFQEPDYWRRWLPLKTTDAFLERWVTHSLAKTDYLRVGGEGPSMGGYLSSKFESFVFDPMLRNIFGQKRSTFNLRQIMDEGKILLVNLAKGALMENNARFLGMVLLGKLLAAAMSRAEVPESQRRDFTVYVDEFQAVATRSFATLLSEGRKFGVNLVLANQFVSQIGDERIVEALFGNAGTLVCFRTGPADSELLESRFAPELSRGDLMNLPNWHAYMSMLVEGCPSRPFSLATVPVETPADAACATDVRDRSRQAHARMRTSVEREIATSLASLGHGPESVKSSE